MENTMKMYITADEVAELLGVSRGYAYKVIRGPDMLRRSNEYDKKCREVCTDEEYQMLKLSF